MRFPVPLPVVLPTTLPPCSWMCTATCPFTTVMTTLGAGASSVLPIQVKSPGPREVELTRWAVFLPSGRSISISDGSLVTVAGSRVTRSPWSEPALADVVVDRVTGSKMVLVPPPGGRRGPVRRQPVPSSASAAKRAAARRVAAIRWFISLPSNVPTPLRLDPSRRTGCGHTRLNGRRNSRAPDRFLIAGRPRPPVPDEPTRVRAGRVGAPPGRRPPPARVRPARVRWRRDAVESPPARRRR